MIKNIYRKIVSEKQRIALHYALYKIEAVLLWGNRYECCCCGKSSRRFLSHGNLGLRKNIKCPHCLSLERTRILCMYIKNEIFKSGIQPMRVLHFAPVKGLKDFLKNSPYVSTYIDADLNPNVATYQADMTRMKTTHSICLSVPIFYIVSQKTERLCRKYIGYCVRVERP